MRSIASAPSSTTGGGLGVTERGERGAQIGQQPRSPVHRRLAFTDCE
jgi:hypothetical protein